MKAKIAVATVKGKPYFLIVNKLKERNIPFISLVPGETVPRDVKVVLTTKKEKQKIRHENIIVYTGESELERIIGELMKILQGKTIYEKIVIGIDPGEVFGWAIVADGRINETGTCFNISDLITRICSMIEGVDFSSTLVTIKIGNGIPTHKDLLVILDDIIPAEVVLEVVSEAGTNRILSDNKHRRGLRDIASAIRIAGRAGFVHQRRKSLKLEDVL